MKVLIIGAGQIGSRHIESLYKSNIKYDLYIVEPNILQQKKLLKILSVYKKKNNIYLFKKLIKFKIIFDVVIIATNSNIRKSVFNILLKKNIFKNILFEKIVFTSLIDYKNTIKQLKSKNINAYVNFPRRSFNFYRKIKQKLGNKKPISYYLIGSNWGFSSNALHNIDLFSYLTGDSNLILDSCKIEKVSQSIKRKNFIDLNGMITIKNKNNDFLILKDLISKSKVTNQLNGGIKIENSEISYHIYESLGKMYEINNKDLISKKYKINIPLQSQLTDKFIKKLILKNKSDLPKLDECYSSHSVFIKGISKELVKINNKYKNNIPIT